jgi:hypothetical protein
MAGTARTIDLASIIARNLAPIAGLLLLGWNAAHMALLYYIDTVVSIGSLVLLLFLHGTDMPIDLSTPKGKAAVALSVAVLAGVYAAVFAWPVIVMFGMSGGGTDLADRAFLGGLAGQLFAACTTFVTMDRQLRGRGAGQEAIIKSRFGIVTLRWVAVLAISFVAPFAVVIVVVYSAASIYWELKPPK